MRKVTAIICIAAAMFAQGARAEDARPRSASEVLRRTVSIFPDEPVALFGSLILRRPSGVVIREVPFAMELDWGADEPTAQYALLDAFGRPLSTMKLTLGGTGATEAEFFDANGEPAAAPPPSSQIAGTDITWLDISLSYLWWKDATLLEPAVFKGTLCDVVEVRPPEPIENCQAVRLWIDRKHSFLRQAEQLGPDGSRVRWMWVASVGKINGRWMIRNLEVKRPGTGTQTKLHVDDLDTP